MLCPVCRQPQVIVEWQDVELDLCVNEHGIWFDAGELRHLFAAAGAPDDVLGLIEDLGARPAARPAERRRCPRCDRKMVEVRIGDGDDALVLDRCTHDHGVWFDHGELEQLARHALGDGHPQLERVVAFVTGFLQPPSAPAEEANS